MVLDPRAQRWLRRMAPERLYTLGEILLLAVLAWQVARLIWTIVTPVDPVGDWRPAGAAPTATAGVLADGFDPFFRMAPAGGSAVVTDLNLTLHGIRADQATGRGSAIVGLPDGSQASYAVGEEIMPGVTLAAVGFDSITVRRGGKDEMLYIDQSLPATTAAPPAMPGAAAQALAMSAPGSAPAEAVAVMSPNPSAAPGGAGLAAETLLTPRIENGRVSGLVLQPRGAGAAFTAAGLQPGDVLISVNGMRVTGADDAGRAAGLFGGAGSVAIEVERGGRIVPLQAKTGR